MMGLNLHRRSGSLSGDWQLECLACAQAELWARNAELVHLSSAGADTLAVTRLRAKLRKRLPVPAQLRAATATESLL